MKAVIMPGFSELIIIVNPLVEVTREGLLSIIMPWLYAPWPEARERGIVEMEVEGETVRALASGSPSESVFEISDAIARQDTTGAIGTLRRIAELHVDGELRSINELRRRLLHTGNRRLPARRGGLEGVLERGGRCLIFLQFAR